MLFLVDVTYTWSTCLSYHFPPGCVHICTFANHRHPCRAQAEYDSSDDDYAGVDLVTDTEDEADVDEVEEQIIIESEQSEDDESTPRPTQDSDEISWEGFEDTKVLGGNDLHFDDGMESTEDNTFATTNWGGAASVPSDEEPVRRVRFADLSSSGDDDEEENYFSGYPDLFVPQEELTQSFRREIEQDDFHSDDSFWDHAAGTPTAGGDGSDADSEESSDSSEYDSMSIYKLCKDQC